MKTSMKVLRFPILFGALVLAGCAGQVDTSGARGAASGASSQASSSAAIATEAQLAAGSAGLVGAKEFGALMSSKTAPATKSLRLTAAQEEKALARIKADAEVQAKCAASMVAAPLSFEFGEVAAEPPPETGKKKGKGATATAKPAKSGC